MSPRTEIVEPGKSRIPEFDVVLIGGSAGSLKPVQLILDSLPENFPVPIIVAMHRGPETPDFRPQLFARSCPLEVKTAVNGDPLRKGAVYIAPPGADVTIEGSRRKRRLAVTDPELRFRPSIDRLFFSAATTFKQRTLAVMLSGRLNDGASGALKIRHEGGIVIAQTVVSAEVPSMPLSTIENGSANCVLDPVIIPHALVSFTTLPGARALLGARSIAA